jgi:hypothetical protein
MGLSCGIEAEVWDYIRGCKAGASEPCLVRDVLAMQKKKSLEIPDSAAPTCSLSSIAIQVGGKESSDKIPQLSPPGVYLRLSLDSSLHNVRPTIPSPARPPPLVATPLCTDRPRQSLASCTAMAIANAGGLGSYVVCSHALTPSCSGPHQEIGRGRGVDEGHSRPWPQRNETKRTR